MRLLLASALMVFCGCQVVYVRERWPAHEERVVREDAKPSDSDLLERGERVSSRFEDVQRSAADDSVRERVYYVPSCSCDYCSSYRGHHHYGYSYGYPYPWWRPSWRIGVYRHHRRWGWGVSWGW